MLFGRVLVGLTTLVSAVIAMPRKEDLKYFRKAYPVYYTPRSPLSGSRASHFACADISLFARRTWVSKLHTGPARKHMDAGYGHCSETMSNARGNRRGDLTGHYDIRYARYCRLLFVLANRGADFVQILQGRCRLRHAIRYVTAHGESLATDDGKRGYRDMDCARHVAGMVVECTGTFVALDGSRRQAIADMVVQMLPWDWDLDVQMHTDTLTMLGQKYNQTRHIYKSADGTVEREYFIDVNPWIWERVRGDGQNIIDARWIDVRNGLFIDITGIAETEPQRYPGILHCKNYHRYHYDDIWPLRDTTFEGVPAKIPYNFDAILIKEYNTKALTVTEYEGFVLPHQLCVSTIADFMLQSPMER
jgi:hypothetical protein